MLEKQNFIESSTKVDYNNKNETLSEKNKLTEEEIQYIKNNIDLLLIEIKKSSVDNIKYDALIKNELII